MLKRVPSLPKPTPPKRPFFPALAFRRIDKAIAAYPKAALFELFDRGFRSPFEQLVACLISVRTLDEVSLPCSLRLLHEARTPEQLLNMTEAEIDRLIAASTFHRAKARTLRTVASEILGQFGGKTPRDRGHLQTLSGVGPKCAALVAGIAGGEQAVSVDVHVHRVTNRWGYVRTESPQDTVVALEGKIARHYWTDINRLVVPFGKHICTRVAPKCSACPVLDMCAQVGVGIHR